MSKRPQVQVWRPPDVEGTQLQWCTEVGTDLPTHFHEGAQIGLIEEGAVDVEVWGESFRASAGMLVLLGARAPHALRGSQSTPVTALVVEVCERRFRALLELEPDVPLPRLEPVVTDDDAAELLRDLHAHLVDGRGWSETGPLLEQLLLHVVAAHGQFERGEVDDESLAAVRAHLDRHVADKLTLDELTGIAGASKYRLVRSFGRRYGVPPLGYQTQLRINRAKALLQDGVPVAQVAAETGFADQSHLTRHFRRLTLMTPAQFQKTARRTTPPE